MIVHSGYDGLKIEKPVVTLGIFDGVHIGHTKLIEALVSRAKSISGNSVIITFDPHPRKVLSHGERQLSILTSPEEKSEILSKMGVDHLIIIPFDHELSNKEACQFIEDVLVNKIGARYLLAGFNHLFGKQGSGDFAKIKRCAESFGIEVEQLEEMKSGDGVVSSSGIRAALESGDIDKANKLLGYSYFINGTVGKGRKIGRELGFPTANIVPGDENKLIPKDGVYAVVVVIGDSEYGGMMSIGSNPTVNDDPAKRTIEVNIFDFENDIYNCQIKVVFRKMIREMKKFEGINELMAQLEDDKASALRYLSE